MNKITENNDISKKIEKKVDQLNVLKEKTIDEKEGWSTVVKRANKIKRKFPIVMQVADDKTMVELKAKMIEKFDPQEVNVSKTFETKNNQLVVMCDDEQHQKEFAEIAKKNYVGLCEVETPKKSKRTIKALNIEVWTKFEDQSVQLIEENVKKANVLLKECKVLRFTKAKINGEESDHRIHILIEVDEVNYDKLMDVGKIRYLYQEVRIVEGFTVGKCFKCLSFDHKAEDCPMKGMDTKVCFKCGGDHLARDCTSENPKCVNCARANSEIRSGRKHDEKHTANDFNCPCYIRKFKFLSSRIK
jgi:hypothetical protein